MNTKEIDNFVEYLIKELCEGCIECEPRLSRQWPSEVVCITEGQIKWLLEMKERYKYDSQTD